MPRKKRKIVLASGVVPMASANPPIAIPRHIGLMPRWTVAELSGRKKGVPPKEYDLLGILLTLPVTLPISPAYGVGKAIMEIKGQAEEESSVESTLRRELVELRMRREANEIREEEFREREAELIRRLEEVRGNGKST